MIRRPRSSPLFPYTPLFRSIAQAEIVGRTAEQGLQSPLPWEHPHRLSIGTGGPAKVSLQPLQPGQAGDTDRKSTRLNSSHSQISYAVFCLKKKKKQNHAREADRREKHSPYNYDLVVVLMNDIDLSTVYVPVCDNTL